MFDAKKYLKEEVSGMTPEQAVEYMCSRGYMNYNAVRNNAVRAKYSELRRRFKPIQARLETAEVFHLSLDHTQRILYDRRYSTQSKRSIK